VAGVGAVAIASPWNDEADETAAASNGAAVTTQARYGQGNGNAQGQSQGRGQGQGYGSTQGQGSGQGHGGQHGRSGQQQGSASGQQHGDPTASLPASTQISDATAQELLYMAEEEKLAHDLYVALGEQYDARQFDNIARAETKHLDAVRVLLDRYDLDDPTLSMSPGEYDNDDLQALYDELLASGSSSLADAAEAGITVETTDIADLTAAIESTDAPDVVQVLSSLRDGSQKHLAAFERLAERA
jgi:hypothetical protein